MTFALGVTFARAVMFALRVTFARGVMFARGVTFALGMTLAPVLAPAGAQVRTDPDSVRLVTTDIRRFWDVVDRATPADLEARFRDDYLASGSAGLRAFAPREIGRAFDFAKDVYSHRARYDSVRAATLQAGDAEPAIRASFRRLKLLYPAATFLDVYFVVGRFAVGGWTRGDTMVVAVEMYPGPPALPAIVAHELVHRQQRPATNDQTLLERAFNEGSADFIGEMISGGNINSVAQRYGRAHEHELWLEFKQVMHGTAYAPWMYTAPLPGRAGDLGYFFGYRIAEAYYNRAPDKAAALREIIRAADASDILLRSGYEP